MPSAYDIQIRSYKYRGVPEIYGIDITNEPIRQFKARQDKADLERLRNGCTVFSLRDLKVNEFEKLKFKIMEGHYDQPYKEEAAVPVTKLELTDNLRESIASVRDVTKSIQTLQGES